MAGLTALFAIATIILLLISVYLAKSSPGVVLKNYEAIFKYYEMGYDDRANEYELRDWSGILGTKIGQEKIKFQR